MAKATSQDAAGEAAIAGALSGAMASATATRKPAASATGVTLQVDAADKSSLSRPQAAALARARALLAPAFTVTLSYQPAEEAGEVEEQAGESGSKAAA